MKSRKKNKEPDSKKEERPFFGKQRDDDTFFQRKEKEKQKDEEEGMGVQAKSEGNTSSASAVSAGDISSGNTGNKGEPLPGGIRSQMESAFGSGFNEVNIHTDEEAAAMSGDLDAQAFTYGQDIFFNKGKFNPGTLEGDALIAHELAHTLQQADGSVKGKEFDQSAEREAEELTQGYLQNRVEGNRGKKLRKPGAGMRLSLQRCPQKTDNGPGPSPQPVKDAGAGDAAVDPNVGLRTELGNVRSFALESKKSDLSVILSDLNKRFQKRQEHLDQKLPLVKGDQKEIVDRMKKRGEAWAKTDMTKWTTTDLDLAISQEEGDKAKLTRDKNTDDVINKFVQALRDVKQVKTEISEEEVEYHRFDTQFMDPQVIELCRMVAHATITPADIKALIGQESGDMTNTTIAGITDKKRGITTKIKNKSYVGIGQQSEDARKEGLDWAASQKSSITVEPGKDPRKDPATAIKLTAAYLGRVSDLLWGALPEPKPGPEEFKKMLFAAYNGGHNTIANAAKDFTKGKIKAYSWSDIKSLLKWEGKKDHKKTDEIRNYVDGIISRKAPAP